MPKSMQNMSKAELKSEITPLRTDKRKLLYKKISNTIQKQEHQNIMLNLFDRFHNATMIFKDNSKIIYINPKFTKLFGYTLKEIPDAKTWFIKAYPQNKYRQEIFKSWKKDLKNSKSKIIEPKIYRVTCKDESVKEIKFSVIFENNNTQIVFLEDITKMIDYEQQVKQKEKKIREIFDNTNDAILLWEYSGNKPGVCLEINDRALYMLGYSRREMQKLSPFSLLNKSNHQDFRSYLKTLNRKKKGIFEGSQIAKSGKEIFVEISSRIFKLDNRSVLLEIIRDVSERKRTENELIDSERKFRNIVENSPIGFMMADNKFKIKYGNKVFAKIVGYKENELEGLDFRIFLDAEFKNIVTERYLNRQKGLEEPLYYEIKILRKNGSTGWIGISSVVTNNQNNIPYTYTQIIDITERKAAHNAIQKSEERFRLMMEQSPLAMQIYDTDGTLIRVNNAWYNLWDIQPDEIILLDYNILKNREPQERIFAEAFHNGLNGQSTEVKDFLYNPQKNKWPGRERYIHTKIYPLRNDDGEVNYVVMLHEDITERKKTELALLQSEERYRGIYENATIGIFSANMECDMLMANPAMLRMLGYSTFEEMKMSILKEGCLLQNEEENYLRKNLSVYGEIYNWETKIRRKDGHQLSVVMNAKVVWNKFGQIEYFEGVVEDITERKQAEISIIQAKEEAEKSSKLKSEFLAQVSHEIRTPVNTILSFSGLISEELNDIIPEDLKPSFTIMKNAGRRMIRTIDLILNMSEIQTGTYQPLTKRIDLLNNVLYDLYLEYLSAAKEKELGLFLNNNLDGAEIYGDEYTIGQIFNNLINNAIKYTHRGKVEIILGKNDEDEIYVDIKDTGIGIADDYMPDLFEPFMQEDRGYTRRFEGNGLGLALVKKYCTLNNARIEVKSKKGKGTQFRVTFNKVLDKKNKLIK